MQLQGDACPRLSGASAKYLIVLPGTHHVCTCSVREVLLLPLAGFEPATFSLFAKRSCQLSYKGLWGAPRWEESAPWGGTGLPRAGILPRRFRGIVQGYGLSCGPFWGKGMKTDLAGHVYRSRTRS